MPQRADAEKILVELYDFTDTLSSETGAGLVFPGLEIMLKTVRGDMDLS